MSAIASTDTAASFLSPHVVEWYTDIYKNVYGQDTTYTDVILKFNDYFKQLVNSTQLTVFYNIVLTLGLVLMLIYFFTDLSEKAVMKQLTQLQLWKSFCALIGTVMVIFNSKYIIIFMLNIVESLNAQFNGRIGYSAVTLFLSNNIVQLLLSRCVSEHFSIWSIIGYTFSAFLLMIVNLAVKAVIMYYAATRTLQLFVYYMFAPIGVADIFENGPGGVINMRSSGMKYLKTIFAIMLQIVVIAIVCNTFPLIATSVNSGYFEDQGSEHVTNAQMAQAVSYPLGKFKYTDHKASVREIIVSGVTNITESVKTLSEFLSDSDSDGSTNEQTNEKLKDSEQYRVLDVVGFDGNIKNEAEARKIQESSRYRMTIQSTELFFDWCIGSDSSKIVLFIILLGTKALMIISASKICNYIVGVTI